MDRELPRGAIGLQKVNNLPGVNQGQCAHPYSSRGRLNSNLVESMWLLLGVKSGARFDSQQLLGFRINLA